MHTEGTYILYMGNTKQLLQTHTFCLLKMQLVKFPLDDPGHKFMIPEAKTVQD